MASSQSKPSDQSNESNSKMNSSNNSSSQSPNLPSAIDNSSQSVSTESSHQEINKTQIPDDSSVEKRFGSLEMKELRTLIDHPMVGAVIGELDKRSIDETIRLKNHTNFFHKFAWH